MKLVLSTLELIMHDPEARLMAGIDLPITISTTQVDGVLRYVEFFNGDLSLGIVSNAPYSMIWSTAPAGHHQIRAGAVDEWGEIIEVPGVQITLGPANNDFADRTILNGPAVHIVGSTAAASTEPGESLQWPGVGGHSVWYEWRAPQSGRFSIAVVPAHAPGFSVTALIAIYSDGATLGGLALEKSSHDALSTDFTAVAGTTYFIQIDSPQVIGWPFALDLALPPANDNFVDAVVLASNVLSVAATNVGATSEQGEPSLFSLFQESVWWSWTAPAEGVLGLDGTAESSYPMLHVFTGDTLQTLELLPGQSNGPWGGVRDLAFPVSTGETYFIAANGQWNSDWSVVFRLNFTARPANDDFSDRQNLTGTHLLLSANNLVATAEPGEHQPRGHSVWFTWTAPVRGYATLTLSSTNSQTGFAIYSGPTLDQLTPVGLFTHTHTSFVTESGATYQILVDGPGAMFELALSMALPAANDTFAYRDPLNGMRAAASGSSFLASNEPGELPHWSSDLGFDWAAVWFSWTAPADGLARIEVASRLIQVYSGIELTNLALLAGPEWDVLRFNAIAGNEYQIAVGRLFGPDEFELRLAMHHIQFVNLTNGMAFPSGMDVPIQLRSVVPEARIERVDLFDGSALLVSFTNEPFSFVYQQPEVGAHWLSARVIGEAGVLTTNEPVEIRIQPRNDNFANSDVVAGVSQLLTATNSGATLEPGEPLSSGASGRTVWWSWTAPSDGEVALELPRTLIQSIGASASFSEIEPASRSSSVIIIRPLPWPSSETSHTGPALVAFTGSSLATLEMVASNLVFDCYSLPCQTLALTSTKFPVAAGQTYHISADGLNGHHETAMFVLRFEPAAPASASGLVSVAGAVPSIPQIEISATPNKTVHLRLTGLSEDAASVLYVSTNLVHWEPIATNAPASGAADIFDISEPGSMRFYRAVTRPVEE